ncbi:OmpA family protein [Bacteroidota bacterium]
MPGQVNIPAILLVCAILSVFSSPVSGQKRKKSRKKEIVTDTIIVTPKRDLTVEPLVDFHNINKITDYYSKTNISQIERFQDDTIEARKLYDEIKIYTSNFGILNFYKDTKLLWRLGQIAEDLGKEEEAKFWYRLVLKHHRSDIDVQQLQQHFDSIAGYERNQYVPIDYYFELVNYRKDIDTLQAPRGVLLNMGHLINSRQSDYGPALDLTNDILLFTSKRNLAHYGIDPITNEDIFLSRRDEIGWNEAEPLDEINTIFNEGSATISNDGKLMIFSRCDAPNTYGNCDLFSTELQEDGTWGNIINLGTLVNSNAWDSHPALSHNGDTLYFASDRIGGFGLSDIFFTFRDRKGNWTQAQNAGPYINTRNNEVSPFYHPDFNVLYFSSNGHLLNFGEFDIYKSYRYGRFWGEPKNIGPLVNGSGSEFYFTIDAESKDLFYAKSIENDMANLDLYSFPLPMEGYPDATARLTGTVINEDTGDPFTSGIITVIDLENGIPIAPRRLSPQGRFEFDLLDNGKYLMIIQSSQFFRIEEIFTMAGNKDIVARAEPIHAKMEFESIEFDKESSELKMPMYFDLDKVAQFMMDNPDFKMKISGHTDSFGTIEYNLDLSRKRAESIMDYIVYFGNVPKARVESFGYGSTQPIVAIEQTDEDRQLNRRVEFELFRPSLNELEEMRKLEQLDTSDNW